MFTGHDAAKNSMLGYIYISSGYKSIVWSLSHVTVLNGINSTVRTFPASSPRESYAYLDHEKNAG